MKFVILMKMNQVPSLFLLSDSMGTCQEQLQDKTNFQMKNAEKRIITMQIVWL